MKSKKILVGILLSIIVLSVLVYVFQWKGAVSFIIILLLNLIAYKKPIFGLYIILGLAYLPLSITLFTFKFYAYEILIINLTVNFIISRIKNEEKLDFNRIDRNMIAILSVCVLWSVVNLYRMVSLYGFKYIKTSFSAVYVMSMCFLIIYLAKKFIRSKSELINALDFIIVGACIDSIAGVYNIFSRGISNVTRDARLVSLIKPATLHSVYFLCIIPIIIILCINIRNDKERKYKKVFYYSSLVLILINLLEAYGRSTILGALIICAIMFSYVSKKFRKYVTISGVCLVVIGCLLLLNSHIYNLFLENVFDYGTEYSRMFIWKQGIEILKRHLFIGNGTGSVLLDNGGLYIYFSSKVWYIATFHNSYMDTIFDMGIIGAIMYYGILSRIIYIIRSNIEKVEEKLYRYILLASYSLLLTFMFIQVIGGGLYPISQGHDVLSVMIYPWIYIGLSSAVISISEKNRRESLKNEDLIGIDEPLVTIVTPSYNQGQYIEETIRSVINQTYKNIQYIIYDSLSTDSTVEILDKYKNKIDIRIEKDKGQTDAINKGFKSAKGELVGWINSDDILEPQCVEKVVKAFKEDNKVGIVYGDTILIDENSNIIGETKNENITYEKILNDNSSIIQPGSFYKSSIVRDIGYLNVELNYVMDFDLWLKILARSKVHYINEPLSRFRLHAASKTVSNYIEFLPEKIRIRNNNGGELFCRETFNILRCYLGYWKACILSKIEKRKSNENS